MPPISPSLVDFTVLTTCGVYVSTAVCPLPTGSITLAVPGHAPKAVPTGAAAGVVGSSTGTPQALGANVGEVTAAVSEEEAETVAHACIVITPAAVVGVPGATASLIASIHTRAIHYCGVCE